MMNLFSCRVAAGPMRKEPTDRSEMVNQILYGETMVIMEEYPDWVKVKLTFDDYEGYVEKKLIKPVSTHQNDQVFTLMSHTLVETSEGFLNVPIGCIVEKGSDAILGLDWSINQFMGTPYLWGGKSTFGTDCSGFVQTVFKIAGINLPRDAYQQVNVGIPVHFISESEPGDLAFFSNDLGKVTHVGIYLGANIIVHASGWVREDHIDQQGIFNQELGKYTHKLCAIRRVA